MADDHGTAAMYSARLREAEQLECELSETRESARCAESLAARWEHRAEEARFEVGRLTRERDDAQARGIHSCHEQCQRPACVMRRERDEARAEVTRARSAEEVAIARAAASEEHAEEWRRALGVARLDLQRAIDDADRLTRERDEARAQLRDLRDAVRLWQQTPPCQDHGPWAHERECADCRRDVIVSDDLCAALHGEAER